jgi:hypothetical protein
MKEVEHGHFVFKQVQSVRMKGIQNKIIISQKAFIIHIYGLHHYKGKLSKFLGLKLRSIKCDKIV